MNPVTGDHVISPSSCRAALAVMTTAGLYETSGEWLSSVGLPGKSGIGGGIVAVAPARAHSVPSARDSTGRATA